MSTPMKHAASQQGRTPSQLAAATPPVSTPFSNPAQAAFSPRGGPRSSPQQVKKSPATMIGSLSGAGAINFDSPSTAAALGIAGGLDMGLDNAGVGVGMGGLAGLGGISTEDDKLKRLEAILDILNKKKGLVSEAGLERLAQRIGLDCLVEDHTAPDGRKTKTLIIAGSHTQIDIALDNNIAQNVTLAFPGLSESTSKHMEAAGPLLLKDLQLLPNQSPLTKTLDRFAANLERLASLDKLSVMPTFDCREALAGMYVSLERLHQWDVAKLREDPSMAGKSDEYVSSMAMCSRHGLPVLHARGRVGLALQYWKQWRFSPPSSEEDAQHDKVWSLAVGCTSAEGFTVPRVRVSEDWISKDVVTEHQQDASMDLGQDETTNKTQEVLDWREPENVSLPMADGAGKQDDMGLGLLQPDLPQVMFSVTIDPPMILPQSDLVHLYQYADMTPPPLYHYAPTFDNLFFPIPPGANQDPSELRTISKRRRVRVVGRDKVPAEVAHRNTLFIYKQIYASLVTEIPFSHPKQLINMLPLLRQYAFISTLLENSFGAVSDHAAPATEDASGSSKMNAPATTNHISTTADELASFMENNSQPPSKTATDELLLQHQQTASRATGEVNMDVILWVHPAPHLQVVFPFRESTVNITLRILKNGVVDVVDENVLERDPANTSGADAQTEAGKARGNGRLTRADLGKVLEHLEDLCKWAEWIRTRLS